MSNTYDPQSISKIFQTLQAQSNNNYPAYNQNQPTQLQDDQTTNQIIEEQSRSELVLQEQLLLSVPCNNSKPYARGDLDNILVNSKQTKNASSKSEAINILEKSNEHSSYAQIQPFKDQNSVNQQVNCQESDKIGKQINLVTDIQPMVK